MICIINASNRRGSSASSPRCAGSARHGRVRNGLVYRRCAKTPTSIPSTGRRPPICWPSMTAQPARFSRRRDCFRPTVLIVLRERSPKPASDPMPRGSTTWEVSRFCVHPGVRAGVDRAVLLHQMTCGVMETALLFGVDAVILVATGKLLSYVLHCGWTATVLGPDASFPERRGDRGPGPDHARGPAQCTAAVSSRRSRDPLSDGIRIAA